MKFLSCLTQKPEITEGGKKSFPMYLSYVYVKKKFFFIILERGGGGGGKRGRGGNNEQKQE